MRSLSSRASYSRTAFVSYVLRGYPFAVAKGRGGLQLCFLYQRSERNKCPLNDANGITFRQPFEQ